MINNTFIKTKDPESANKLRLQGFQELTASGEYFVFLNKDAANFDGINHLLFTNILYM